MTLSNAYWKKMNKKPRDNSEVIVWCKVGYRRNGSCVVKIKDWVEVLTYSYGCFVNSKHEVFTFDVSDDCYWSYWESPCVQV